jgi:hypothetical protein
LVGRPQAIKLNGWCKCLPIVTLFNKAAEVYNSAEWDLEKDLGQEEVAASLKVRSRRDKETLIFDSGTTRIQVTATSSCSTSWHIN